MLAGSFFSFIAASCGGGWHTFREGSYQGVPYAFQERASSGFMSDVQHIDHRICLGNLSPVPVEATTMDWGPPYSTDIYGTASYLYVDNQDTTYRGLPFAPGTTGVAHTMLYVSPKTLNEKEFEQFHAFMKAEWPATWRSLASASGSLRDFPHIIGLVYGRQDDFAKVFKGTHGGKAMRLVIEPDGRVRFMRDDKWRNEEYSGLAEMVQMPGKRLLLDTGGHPGDGLTPTDLHTFRDERGAAVDAFFDIRPTNLTALRETGRAVEEQLKHKWHATHMQDAAGQRQPLEQGADGSYLWLQWGGIAEERDTGAPQSARWSYDELSRSITVLTDSSRSLYHLKSVSDTELVLEQDDATMGRVGLVLHRVAEAGGK